MLTHSNPPKALTLQKCGGGHLSQARQHKVGQHFDIIMVAQPALQMIEKLEHINPVETCVQQGVHAFECGLANVQAIVHRVLERTHLYFTDQSFLGTDKIGKG